jgi:hypothetical protein
MILMISREEDKTIMVEVKMIMVEVEMIMVEEEMIMVEEETVEVVGNRIDKQNYIYYII